MRKTGSAKHNLRLHTGCMVQVAEDGRVAINDADGLVHIYSNSSLTNELARLNVENYPFHLMNKGRVLVEERSGFKIYDVVNNNNVVVSKTWKSLGINGEVITRTSISSDGKYAYVLCTENVWASDAKVWIELLEIKNNDVTLLDKTDGDATIQSISFNPLKPTEAIIQYYPYRGNKFVIVNVLTKKMKEIRGEFMNIDPFTGNILYRGEEYWNEVFNLYVQDKNYTKEIIKIRLANVNVWAESYLINNNLFFNGYYLNLSNLKEWNQ